MTKLAITVLLAARAEVAATGVETECRKYGGIFSSGEYIHLKIR